MQEAREEQERRKREVEASRREYEELQQKLDEEYQERLRKEQMALEEPVAKEQTELDFLGMVLRVLTIQLQPMHL